MPTYTFECGSCGARPERFASMSAVPRTVKCPECGGRAVRLIGPGAGMIFKGSGFHATDYRSSEYKKDSGRDAASKGPGEDAAKESGKTAPAAPAKKKEPKGPSGSADA